MTDKKFLAHQNYKFLQMSHTKETALGAEKIRNYKLNKMLETCYQHINAQRTDLANCEKELKETILERNELRKELTVIKNHWSYKLFKRFIK